MAPMGSVEVFVCVLSMEVYKIIACRSVFMSNLYRYSFTYVVRVGFILIVIVVPV